MQCTAHGRVRDVERHPIVCLGGPDELRIGLGRGLVRWRKAIGCIATARRQPVMAVGPFRGSYDDTIDNYSGSIHTSTLFEKSLMIS